MRLQRTQVTQPTGRGAGSTLGEDWLEETGGPVTANVEAAAGAVRRGEAATGMTVATEEDACATPAPVDEPMDAMLRRGETNRTEAGGRPPVRMYVALGKGRIGRAAPPVSDSRGEGRVTPDLVEGVRDIGGTRIEDGTDACELGRADGGTSEGRALLRLG